MRYLDKKTKHTIAQNAEFAEFDREMESYRNELAKKLKQREIENARASGAGG